MASDSFEAVPSWSEYISGVEKCLCKEEYYGEHIRDRSRRECTQVLSTKAGYQRVEGARGDRGEGLARYGLNKIRRVKCWGEMKYDLSYLDAFRGDGIPVIQSKELKSAREILKFRHFWSL